MVLKDIYKIIGRYLYGKESADERRQLYRWYDSYNSDQGMGRHPDSNATKEVKIRLFNAIKKDKRKNMNVRILAGSVVAAAVMLFFFNYGLRNWRQQEELKPLNKDYLSAIMPKVANTVFKSSDGSLYAVNTLAENDTVTVGRLLLVKKSIDKIELIARNAVQNAPAFDYTLTTPLSAMCTVVLPDKSQVVVQAESEISFSDGFAFSERNVTLEGEAFFEVAKNSTKFVVETGEQKVEVLGTKFNIQCDRSNNEIKTALLEGSVKILNARKSGNPTVLKPGEQGVFKNNDITVSKTDTSSIAAWRDGFFVFDEDNIQKTFDQIAKWYDIEVSYKGDMNSIRYDGKIPTSLSLDKLIESLQYAEIPNQTYLNKEGKVVLVVGK